MEDAPENAYNPPRTQTARNIHALGRSLATSPGVRTIPAEMVFPIAAAMPNHIPRTWSRRPRPTAGAELAVEEASDVPDNVKSRGIRETQPSYRGEEKMQAGSGGGKVVSDQLSVFSKSRK